MTTLDRPNSPFTFPARETVPTGWVRPHGKEEKTPFQVAKENFVHWNHKLTECEALAAEHVFNNPDFTPVDARQHCAMLHLLIGNGELLVVDFIMLNMPSQAESYISFLDDNLKRLNGLLHEWHGPIGVTAEIPEDFVTGMRQISEGKFVDLAKALNEPSM